MFPQVGNLDSGHFYQFRVFAANVAGVGKPSEASKDFLCEKWTMPEPGKDTFKSFRMSFRMPNVLTDPYNDFRTHKKYVWPPAACLWGHTTWIKMSQFL